jgi:hypothetical protein
VRPVETAGSCQYLGGYGLGERTKSQRCIRAPNLAQDFGTLVQNGDAPCRGQQCALRRLVRWGIQRGVGVADLIS